MSKKKDNSIVNICIIVGIVFLVASLALMFNKGNKDNNIVEIDYNKYNEIINENEYNIILLTSPTCSHCLNYKPYVNYVASENNLTVYNLNLDSLKYEQYVEIHDMYTVTKNQYGDNNVPGIPTPVTIITKNGVEVASILGNIGQKGFENLLKTNGVIK